MKIKKIITGIIICTFLITATALSVSRPIHLNPKDDSNSPNLFLNPDPNTVFVQLDVNGVAIGHELLWTANTTGTNYEESAVAYVDGMAYIGSCSTHGQGHDKLFAVNTSNGEIIWDFFTGPGYVGPVIDDDVVYIGTSYHDETPTEVYAINRFTGEEIWNITIPGGVAESIQFDDEKIYFCSSWEDTMIYALNKDGSINWTFPTGMYYCANKPMLKDNAFYAAFYYPGGRMFKLDATDGTEIWNITLSDGPWDNSITADGDGRIFLPIYYDTTMNAYWERNGSLIWSFPLTEGSLSFNAYHNGVVFIADTSGHVYAINGTYGNIIWIQQLDGIIDISSPTISGGLIFIGTRRGGYSAFYALNETTGDILWKYNVGASVTAPPSIADGMMMCGTDGWLMYAFDVGVGGGDWTLHRYDSFNTAYSPFGITQWQYVEANSTTEDEIVTSVVTNHYDHDVFNITLDLNFDAYWYDSYRNLLKHFSDFYLLDTLSSLESTTIIITTNPFLPPEQPTIDGPTSGVVESSYEYSFTCTDPDDDDVFYKIDWGDGNITEWHGPFESGETITLNHTWMMDNVYNIKTQCKDEWEYIGDWSDEFVVSIESKPFIRGDADSDEFGEITMGDTIYILRHLYVPGAPIPSCMDSADVDDNGIIEMGDAVYLLRHLYVPGSPIPPSPGPEVCGPDPTPDGLGCQSHSCFE